MTNPISRLFARPRNIGPLLAATKSTLSATSSSVVLISRCSHRFVLGLQPWVSLVTYLVAATSLVTFMSESEDRQTELTIQAWQVVLADAERPGTSRRGALEYLNRRSGGFGCGVWVSRLSETLGGNPFRRCLILNKTRVSLRGIDLRGADLRGADLREADLREADLRGVYLPSADLKGADLEDADLRGAILLDADLEDADLRDADLRCVVDLRCVDDLDGRTMLLGANLRGADLRGADLTDAILTRGGFVLPNVIRLPGAAAANLADANLSKADLNNTELTQMQLDAACGLGTPENIPPGRTWNSRPCPGSSP